MKACIENVLRSIDVPTWNAVPGRRRSRIARDALCARPRPGGSAKRGAEPSRSPSCHSFRRAALSSTLDEATDAVQTRSPLPGPASVVLILQAASGAH